MREGTSGAKQNRRVCQCTDTICCKGELVVDNHGGIGLAAVEQEIGGVALKSQHRIVLLGKNVKVHVFFGVKGSYI